MRITTIGFVLVPFGPFASGHALAQGTERISVSTGGSVANEPVETLTRASDDGRFVAFTTRATNIVTPDAPFTRDVFLRDRTTGTTTRVRADGIVSDITPDGRRLAYTRTSTAVAAIVDLVTNAETALTGIPILSEPGTFSADGRFLLFARGDAGMGGLREVVRREIATAVDDVVSTNWMGMTNQVRALPGRLSADGTIATFTTADPDIVPGDTNAADDAFYKDYGFGFGDRYSVDALGGQLPGDSIAGAVTPDTRYLVFSTESAALVADTNGTWDVYVLDRFLGELRRASLDSAGIEGNASSQSPNAWIAVDGTRVYFDSLASNLVANDTNGARDVFEHDFSTGTTRRVVVGVGGAQPDQGVELRGVSTDGRYLTVVSAATNLVAGAQTGTAQAYLVDLGPQCFVSSYCEALPNSTGASATIQSTGTPSFAVNNFVLSALDLPANSPCVFFHGTTRLDVPVAFGDGLRCTGGTLKRLGTTTATGGGVIQFQDLLSTPYAGIQPGDVRRFQLLYRDPAAMGAGFNTTAALEVTFCP